MVRCASWTPNTLPFEGLGVRGGVRADPFSFSEEASVSALVEMAAPSVATVEMPGVGDMEVAHELGEVAPGVFRRR